MLLVNRRVVASLWVLSASFVGLARAADLPGWMSQPPPDDAQWWYGTGEGPDLEAARRGALRAVAAKLRVSVEGQVRNVTRVQSSNGGKEKVDIDALTSVVEQVARTDFTRFEVVQSARGGQGVYALVKVDRAAFVADTRNQLQVLDKPVRDVEAALPKQSALDQFLALRRVSQQLDDGVRLSLLLQGAGADAEGKGFLRYASLQQLGKSLPGSLTFELRPTPADADIASLLMAYFTEQGIRTSRQRLPGASALTIASSGREDDLFGSKMLKLKVSLAVMDDKGRAAASREYEISGSSRYDFKGAREDALRKLGDNLRKAGPLAALGFPDQ